MFSCSSCFAQSSLQGRICDVTMSHTFNFFIYLLIILLISAVSAVSVVSLVSVVSFRPFRFVVSGFSTCLKNNWQGSAKYMFMYLPRTTCNNYYNHSNKFTSLHSLGESCTLLFIVKLCTGNDRFASARHI